MDLDPLLGLFQALSDEGVAYVLVGGVALNVHGIIRATEDVDLFVRAEEDNIRRLRAALRKVWDDADIDQISAEDLAGEYPVVRYGPPDFGLVIDVIARLGDAIRFEDVEWTHVAIDGVSIAVATPAMLHRMKRDTVRTIDKADAEALRERFGLEGS